MSKYTIYASTDGSCDERLCLEYQIGDNALHPFRGNMIQLPIARTQPGPGHEWIGVKVRYDPGVGWMFIVTSPGDSPGNLEAKHLLLERTQVQAVNQAFRGLLKRLGIERDRAKLTEDDMYRLITSGLLGWEFPSAAEVACITAAERVMAAFDPRLIGSDLGDDPTDDCEPAFTPPTNLDR